MKDKLEDFITDNKEEFDIYEPSPEVWNKIIINEGDTKIRKISWSGVLWKAAAVAVIFVLSFYANRYLSNRETNLAVNNETLTDQSVSEIEIPELVEAEAYYTSQVNQKMNEVKKFAVSYPELESDIMVDLSELDSICKELRDDLKDNIANEEIIDAMIQNYRLKLQILEDILTHLQKSNEKTEEDEKVLL